MKKFLMFLVLASLIFPGIPEISNATVISYNFSGTLNSVQQNDDFISTYGNRFSVGDAFTGSLSYNTEAIGTPGTTIPPFVDGSSMGYGFNSPPYGISVTVNGYTFQTDPDTPDSPADSEFGVGVLNANDNEPVWNDELIFWSTRNISPFNFDLFTWIRFDLLDPTNQALDSDKLPTSIDLSDWSQESILHGLRITGANERDIGGLSSLYLTCNLDSLTAAPVPEPSTIFLISFGLAGLAGFGRKRMMQ